MAIPNENLEAIANGLRAGENESLNASIEWGEAKVDSDITDAQAALAELRQQLADYQALSDTVLELARIEQAYTRQPDNTWPEWDSAYDAMYTINKRIRSYQQSPENDTKQA